MKPLHLFSYTLIIFLAFYAIFIKKSLAENKYYNYEIDEQIRISGDKDYAQHLKRLSKQKALERQARKKQKLMREKERLAYERTRKKQVRQRRRMLLSQKRQEQLRIKHEAEVKRREKWREKLHLQYAKQRRRERQSLLRRQASIENSFYRTHRPALK